MKNQKPRKLKSTTPPGKEIKGDGDVPKSVVISGDNNVVNLGGKETKANLPKNGTRTKKSKLSKWVNPTIVAALIGLAGTIVGVLLNSPSMVKWIDSSLEIILSSTTIVSDISGGFDFVTNMCSATWYSDAGELPCPGIEGDERGFVLKVDKPNFEFGITDIEPSLFLSPQNINNGYVQGFYPAYQVQKNDHFRSTVVCRNGAITCFPVFRLDYLVEGSSDLSTYWALTERYDGFYYQASVDLSPLEGRTVQFVLTVLSVNPLSNNHVYWVGPTIVNH